MKIALFTSLFVLTLLFIFFFCGDQNTTAAPPINFSQMQIKEISATPYIAYTYSDNKNDLQKHLQEFISEAQTQRIIPTGPIFLITESDSRQEFPARWEFGCPTAEGTMVKTPLQVKSWKFDRVISFQFISTLEQLPHTRRLILSQLYSHSIIPSGPIVFRILSPLQELATTSTDLMPMEVCIPVSQKSLTQFIAN